MAKAAAVRMPPEASAARGCEGARRVLALMLAFSAEKNTLSARDLAAATGIALPSVYRYITLLRETGLLAEGDRGNFRLSARMIGLARAAEAAESIIEIADPVMRTLVAETEETVILVRLIGRSAVCVHRVESEHHLRTTFEPGQPLPLERGASARILLAGLTPEVRRDYLAGYALRDPDGAAQLEEKVVLAAQRGWAVSEEEIDRGVWAASAPVLQGRRTVAALTIPSPLTRAPAGMREQRLIQIRSAARAIGAALSGIPNGAAAHNGHNGYNSTSSHNGR